MSILKKLAGQVATYGFSSILARAANFLLLPLHTAVFSPSQFAETILFFTLAGFLNIVYTFGMETTYFRFCTKENADRESVFATAQTLVVIVSALISVSLLVFRDHIVQAWGFENNGYINLLALILFFDALMAIPFARLRLEGKAGKFAVLRTVSIGINVFFNVIFLLALVEPLKRFFPVYTPVYYVFMANLLASVITLMLFGKSPFRLNTRFDPNMVITMFWYSLPVMVTGLAGMANEMADRPLIEAWLPDNFYEGKSSREAMGIYSAAFKLSVFMTLAIQAFRYAAEPYFFSQSTEHDSKSQYAHIMHWFVIVCLAIFVVLSANLHILELFISKPVLREGVSIVPILLLASLCLGVYYNLSIWFKLADRTYFGTLITLIGAGVTVAGNYILIPLLGYTGAAISHLLCYAVMMVVCYFSGRVYYPVPYNISKASIYVIIAVILVLSSLAVKPLGFWSATVFGLVPVLIFILTIAFLEKANLRNLKI